MTGFDVHQRIQPYHTTFGDPLLTRGGHSDYPRVVAELYLQRAHPAMTFFTMTVAMYAAVLLALVQWGNALAEEEAQPSIHEHVPCGRQRE